MDIVRKKDLVPKFVEYLIEMGYPSDTIKIEYPICGKGAKGRSRLDIAVVVKDKVIQAFEFKSNLSSRNFDRSTEQIEYYQQEIGEANVKVKVYLIAPNNRNSWDIYSADGRKIVNKKEVLNYNKNFAKLYSDASSQINEKRPSFKWVIGSCVGVATALLLYVGAHILLFALRYCDKPVTNIPLTSEIVTMLGIISVIALVPALLPFIKRLKIGLIELDFLVKEYFDSIKDK